MAFYQIGDGAIVRPGDINTALMLLGRYEAGYILGELHDINLIGNERVLAGAIA